MLGVAQRQSDRDEPLLGAVVEVALDPAALLVAGRDDPRARGLDLLELAAQLDVQAGDLDREPGGLHHLLEQPRTLRVDGPWITSAERDARRGRRASLAASFAAAPGARASRRTARSPEASSAARARGRTSTSRSSGSTASGAAFPARRSSRKRLDAAQGVVARAAEAPVDGVLNASAQRAERGRGRQRGAGRRPGRAAAERGPEHQRGGGIGRRRAGP